jgi:hypothetical protein
LKKITKNEEGLKKCPKCGAFDWLSRIAAHTEPDSDFQILLGSLVTQEKSILQQIQFYGYTIVAYTILDSRDKDR